MAKSYGIMKLNVDPHTTYVIIENIRIDKPERFTINEWLRIWETLLENNR